MASYFWISSLYISENIALSCMFPGATAIKENIAVSVTYCHMWIGKALLLLTLMEQTAFLGLQCFLWHALFLIQFLLQSLHQWSILFLSNDSNGFLPFSALSSLISSSNSFSYALATISTSLSVAFLEFALAFLCVPSPKTVVVSIKPLSMPCLMIWLKIWSNTSSSCIFSDSS